MLEQAVLIICIVLGIEYYIIYLHKRRIEKLENELLQVHTGEPDNEDEKDNN